MELTELDSVVEGSRLYPPFEDDDRFDFDTKPRHVDVHPPRWFVLTDAGVDLVRIEVEVGSRAGSTYRVVAPPSGFVQVVTIETASDCHRQGHGRRAMELLIERFPGRAFCAFSEADEFWAALGFKPHFHPRGRRYQTFFTRSVLRNS